ncbi:MAG: RagB/SusD family nutrient uptake outer membrane protein [Mucilaginibacter sp.]|nr:MAG: RagB/SusD family nutrient uptake outer membrane protein [Mucilaginibacter sp.]
MKKLIRYTMLLTLSLSMAGCKKYLDEKSDQKLVVPGTLADFQSILDNYSKNVFSDPGEGEVSSTDYYLTDANYNALSLDSYRREYTWQKDYLFETGSNSWYYGYTSIYSANSVLDNMGKVERNSVNQTDWDNIKGQALYLRGKNFLNMAYLWTLAYDPSTASQDMGLPLRLNTDFNQTSVRSSVQQTYDQIISDLKSSVHLLPIVSLQVVRPSRPAAYALLARTYLSMRQYQEAGLYADSCLQLFNTLIDYNTLTASATYPLKQFNAETIIFSVIGTPSPINPRRAKIDPGLYNLYTTNDLRKIVFFKNNNNGSYAFKGNYTGTLAPFGGISTNEVYLIRAEASARQGKTTDAMNDLNTLLVNRWKAGTFVPLTASSASNALSLILLERRKELLLRGLRWMDLKRLNKDGANITLTRTVNGQVYTLPPNDLRYALPIPEDVIALSGITQNLR